MRSTVVILSQAELDAWPKPIDTTIDEAWRTRYNNGVAGLTAVLSGELSIMHAARDNRLCHKRLRAMVERAPQLAKDGEPFGFRVCVPWGAYHALGLDERDAEMPRLAGPHAMAQLMAAQPAIRGWVESFRTPLPPGRPPRLFERRHTRIVTELKRLDLGDFYPLNQPDQGRRALLTFLRKQRLDGLPYPTVDDNEEAPTALEELVRGRAYHRGEVDAHKIDIEAVLGVAMPNGGVVRRAITTMWLLCLLETESRAILSWHLRVGRGYNSLDLATCVARSLHPWVRRELTIPNLEYQPGAGMPCGLAGPLGTLRLRSIALDNAKAHHALSFEAANCRAHGAILDYGRAHEPRSRGAIEQLFSRLENGVLRDLPGGFEPAKRLGDNKIRISNFAPDALPIQLHLFEELLDVVIANYNATPHPAIGNLSPLQYLQMQPPRAFDPFMPNGEKDASEMCSVLVPLTVKGNRKTGILPHVNYMYVRYRCPELENNWELLEKTVYARIYRHDLRTIYLMRTATRPLGLARAARPWDRTRHDETTRALIMQWCKQRGGLTLVGADCAIAAYVAHLRKLAPTSSQATDQLARMQQAHGNAPPTATVVRLPTAAVQVPRRGWISLDSARDR